MITIDPPSSLPSTTDPPTKGAEGVRASVDAGSLRRSLGAFVRRAREAAGLRGEVSVLLTDDATMRRLNREFRGKRKSTDVLSFPAERMEGLPEEMQTAGDLAISLPIAMAQADLYGHSLQTELRVLLLHGMLHLSGMDHETDEGEMAAREAELRVRLRLPVAGLIGRVMHGAGRGSAGRRRA